MHRQMNKVSALETNATDTYRHQQHNFVIRQWKILSFSHIVDMCVRNAMCVFVVAHVSHWRHSIHSQSFYSQLRSGVFGAQFVMSMANIVLCVGHTQSTKPL